jgi:hypothetical protein
MHTAAPWIKTADAVIRSEGVKLIAIVGDPNFIPRIDDVANANLMVAAPDLLAAARSIMMCHIPGNANHSLVPDTDLCALRDAVAKAVQ